MAFRVELLLLAILVSLSFGSVDSDDGESFDPKALCPVCMPTKMSYFIKLKKKMKLGFSEQRFFFFFFIPLNLVNLNA